MRSVGYKRDARPDSAPADGPRLHPSIDHGPRVPPHAARDRPDPARFAEVRLYVLITESCCKRPWLEAAEEAILGGADCLQLREKDLDSGELLSMAGAGVATLNLASTVSGIVDPQGNVHPKSGSYVGTDSLVQERSR